MNLDSAEFIRVGTSYFAIIERPTISKDTEKIMISWNKETIVNDLGKDYISAIKKYYGFCCIPQHINYEREIGDFYNIYHPLDYDIEMVSEIDLQELQSKIPYTLQYIRRAKFIRFRLSQNIVRKSNANSSCSRVGFLRT